jgi:hypothetical protein
VTLVIRKLQMKALGAGSQARFEAESAATSA